MATNCCTSCGMAVRASVDNCAAGAEATATSKSAGIEILRKAFNESILHICGSSRIHGWEPASNFGLFPVLDGQERRSCSIFILLRSLGMGPMRLSSRLGRSYLSRPGQRSRKAALQYLGLRIEPRQLTHPLAIPLTGSLGEQSDDL